MIPTAALLCAMTLSAEDNPQFTGWMKTTGAAMGDLRKLDPKTGDKAVKAAEDLKVVFDSLIGFWTKRGGADDAVKISEEGKAAAALLATAAGSGDAAKAADAFKTLGGTCKSCHDAHRVKIGANKYDFK